MCFVEIVFPILSQTWDGLLLPYACRYMNRVKHRVFFKCIFFCLPLPRGRISPWRIKNVITFANIKTIIFDPRQDAAENFLHTEFQPILELDQASQMKRKIVMTIGKSGNPTSQISDKCSIGYLKLWSFHKRRSN